MEKTFKSILMTEMLFVLVIYQITWWPFVEFFRVQISCYFFIRALDFFVLLGPIKMIRPYVHKLSYLKNLKSD